VDGGEERRKNCWREKSDKMIIVDDEKREEKENVSRRGCKYNPLEI